MVLVKTVKSRKGCSFRKRRFHCEICDYDTTIYADGIRDLKIEPQLGIEDAKADFKNKSREK